MESILLKPLYIHALAAHIAPKNDVRHYLNGVRVEVRDGLVFYIATDGRMLAALKHEARPEEDGIEFTIPRADAIKIKRKKNKPFTVANRHEDTHTWRLPDLAQSFGTIEGQYPDWRKVLPSGYEDDAKAFKENECAAYDFDLLARLQAAYREANEVKESAFNNRRWSPTAMLTLHSHRSTLAAPCTGPCENFLGLLMPYRAVITKPEDFPNCTDWLVYARIKEQAA